MPKNSPNTTASLKHEHEYYASGYPYIFGLDEAGRGPWAGPVAAGAVCLPLDRPDVSKVLPGVRDSKQLTPRARSGLVARIQETALTWGVGSASNTEIDEIGIVPAVKLAMRRALDMALAKVDFAPNCLFLDALLWPEMMLIPQVSIIGGDQRSLSIAAASVLAKVWRDEYMIEVDKELPQYGFAIHKGYGTAKHQAALATYGPSPLHRLTFAPVRKVAEAHKTEL
ncbi:MAG TPA: ribonuclease HII [Phototrophicaceae bacterium]|nr:ribonuclease HII [Phototrophicaceae bacterium]